MTEMPRWLLGLFQLTILITLLSVTAWWWIAHLKKLKNDNFLWVEFFAPGIRYTKLIRRDGNTFQHVDKGTKKGFVYTLREDSVYPANYPPGLPSFLQVEMPYCVYHEGDPEPVIKERDEPVYTAELIYNYLNEQFTKVSVEFSRTLEDMSKKLQGVLNPMLVYILLAVTILIAGFNAYSSITMKSEIQTIKQSVEVLKAGQGLK